MSTIERQYAYMMKPVWVKGGGVRGGSGVRGREWSEWREWSEGQEWSEGEEVE